MRACCTIIYAIFLLCQLPLTLQAQFLKKLSNSIKETAKEVVLDDSRPSSSNVSSNNSAVSKNQSKFQATDLEKHDITVVHAGSASFEANEYFLEKHSFITVTDSGITATVAVYHSTSNELSNTSVQNAAMDIVYIYENGIKTKIIAKDQLNDRSLALNTKYDWYPDINVVNTDVENKYIENGTLTKTIVFNGKRYGPYHLIYQMIVSKDKARFYALVSPTLNDMEAQKCYLLSADGKLTTISFGGNLMANIDFTAGCIILSPVTILESRLAREKDEEKQAALQQQMTDMELNHRNEDDVIFFSGKKLKRVITEYKWLDCSGNNIFSTKTDSGDGFEAGLYLNNKKIANNRPHEGHAWCTADATDWAYGSMGELEDLAFKDGTQVHNAYHPRQIEYRGKSYLVWFMYDRTQSDEIVLCSKAL